MKLNTYLNSGGNCEQAFRFYVKHLGGNRRVGPEPEQPTEANTLAWLFGATIQAPSFYNFLQTFATA